MSRSRTGFSLGPRRSRPATIAEPTSSWLARESSATNHAPSANWAADSRASSVASDVLPVPPGPMSVRSRAPSRRRPRSSSSSRRPTKLVSRGGRVDRPPSVRSGGKSPDRPSIVELVEPLGRLEALEPVLAHVPQRHPRRQGPCGKGTGRVRDQDLAAMRRRGDPGRAVDVEADVIVAAADALAAVQPHPNGDGAPVRPVGRGERTLCLDRRGDRRRRVAEDHEEGVALGATLDAARGRQSPIEGAGDAARGDRGRFPCRVAARARSSPRCR